MTGSRRAPVMTAALLLAAALLPFVAGAAGMALSARTDRDEVALGETLVLEVRIEADEAPTVSLPSNGFEFDVLSRGSSRSTSINMGGGAGMQVHHVFTFQFVLRPRRAGETTIPPIEATAGAAKGETSPLQVKVLPAGTPSQRPATPGQGLGSPIFPSVPGFPGAQPRQPPNGGSSRAWHGWERDLQVVVELDKPSVFLGEQVTASVWIFSAVGLDRASPKPPAYDGFWTEELETPTELRQQVRKRDGIPLRAYLQQRVALFPTRSGPLELGSFGMDLVVRVASDDPFYPFGDLQQVSRQSTPLTIDVKALPPGAPAGFDSVNVATATLTATLSTPTAALGQPVTFRLVAEGEGNVKAWALPSLPAVPGTRAFAPTSNDKVAPKGMRLAGTRAMETMLVPERPGTLVVPSLSWTIFDPKTGTYRVLKTAELKLEVPEPAPAPGAPSAAPPTAHGMMVAGLRPIRAAGPLRRGGAPDGTGWPLWLLLAGPLAGFGLLTGVDRLRERHAAEGSSRRVKSAGRVARKRLAQATRLALGADGLPFFAEVERALVGYCGDKLGRSAAGLTREELARALTEAGAHPPALRALTDALDACDAGRFGGSSEREALLTAAARAMALLEEAHWQVPGGGA